MKSIVFFLAIAAFSCNTVEVVHAPEFTIRTEKQSYNVGYELSVKVTFTNSSGRELKIHNDGCSTPGFTLEMYEGNRWKTVGSRICVALHQLPTPIADRQQFETVSNMISDASIVSGVYRMKYDVYEDPNVPIETPLLYSNTFLIVRE